MKILTVLLTIAVLALGFVGGMTFVTIFNAEQMRELRDQNKELRRDLAALKKRKANTIEIIDNRAEPESYFTPF